MASDMTSLILASRNQIESTVKSLEAPVMAASDLDGGSKVNFTDSFKDAVRSVDDQDRQAAAKMADVDAGRSGDLVGAMLASQEASLSFSMLMQVRNKVMGAMEELVKLPL